MKTRLLLALTALLVLAVAQCGGGEDGTRPVAPDPAPQSRQDPAPIPADAPRVRMCISGSMHGRLEPCGCASGQLGGLARRAFLLNQPGQPYDLLLEGGDLVEQGTELDFQKLYKAAEILFAMRRPYHALGVGPRDLRLPLPDWCGILTGLQVPVVASDLRCLDESLPWPGRPFVEVKTGAGLVRVLSLTVELPRALAEAEPRVLELLAPEVAWQQALAGAADPTLRVLMVHADPDRIRKLVPALQPPPDLVIGVTDAYGEPPGRPEMLGAVPVVYPGIRGRMLLDVTLARLPEGPRVGYQVVPLRGSETKPGAMEDTDVKTAILQHRFQVKEDRVLQKLAGAFPTATGAAYVGSESCMGCHLPAYQIWKASKHGHAWETLVKAEKEGDRYPWPVTAYPDCVSCHVVGYREQTGFVDGETTPLLGDVGCERCHGPGSLHNASPMRNKMGKVGGGIAARLCTECHDFEQSPDFDYRERWSKIQHGK
jgi:hypothetical protein